MSTVQGPGLPGLPWKSLRNYRVPRDSWIVGTMGIISLPALAYYKYSLAILNRSLGYLDRAHGAEAQTQQ